MKIYKKIRPLIPFAIIFSALLFAGFTSYILALKPQEIKKNVVSSNDTEYKMPDPTATPRATQTRIKQKIKAVNTPTPSPIANSEPKPNAIISPTATPLPTPQINHLNISINNSTGFTLLIEDGANQCDVLSKSLSDGKIASLNMKYDSRYNTYGVYQINGIGKENQIWWTFSVNGTNPPQGCSQVKANNNDNIVWTYIGPN